VNLLPADRLLDIACGAGIVAGVSKERIGSAGHVAGVDLCPEMFAIARAVALDIGWREDDVSALPLRDGELGRRCRLPTGQACSGSRDAASRREGPQVGGSHIALGR
jgi:SAM-dependent methyltransferase